MGTSSLLKYWTIIQTCVYFSTVSSPSHAIVIRKVTTAKQFQRTLDKANPGDIIQLENSNQIFFEGIEFIARKSGKVGYRITIRGTSQSQDGGSGSVNMIKVDSSSKNSFGTTALTITGDYWNVEGITLLSHEPHVGIRVDGNNNYLSSLTVRAAETGIYLNGNGNTVIDSVINATEGTGIYLKGSGHNVTWNTVEGRDWAMYFKGSSSCCDLVTSNTVKGPVMVQGFNHHLEDNIIKGDLLVADCNNKFTDVFVYSKNYQGQFEDNCESVDAGVFYLR